MHAGPVDGGVAASLLFLLGSPQGATSFQIDFRGPLSALCVDRLDYLRSGTWVGKTVGSKAVKQLSHKQNVPMLNLIFLISTNYSNLVAVTLVKVFNCTLQGRSACQKRRRRRDPTNIGSVPPPAL